MNSFKLVQHNVKSASFIENNEKEKKKIKCFEKSMLKRPGSPRKRDNTVDFLKIKTYNNQNRIRMQKSISFFKIRKRGN